MLLVEPTLDRQQLPQSIHIQSRGLGKIDHQFTARRDLRFDLFHKQRPGSAIQHPGKRSDTSVALKGKFYCHTAIISPGAPCVKSLGHDDFAASRPPSLDVSL